MNKKLISLAVAAAMAAPAAAMAEATLYGKLHVSIDYQDVTNAIAPTFARGTGINPDTGEEVTGILLGPDGRPVIDVPGQDFEGWGIAKGNAFMQGEGRANRIGVKGSEDLGNGLKAIYQVEFGINLSDTNNNLTSGSDSITYRNTFVGLAGDWGTFLVGRHDTPMKISTGKLDLFSDTMADYNGTVGFQDIRADNAIAYISPSWGGFSFAGALVAPGGATGIGATNINSDSLAGAYSLAAIYSNGPFYGSVAYEVLNNEMFMTTATSVAGECLNPDGTETLGCAYVGDDFSKWRVGLGLLDWNGFTLTAIWENQDDLPGGKIRTPLTLISPDGVATVGSLSGIDSQDLYQVQAAYAFGNNEIKAMYGWVDRGDTRVLGETRDTLSLESISNDLAGDRSTWAIGFDHNFSKRTKAYVLYTQVDDDNSDNVLGTTADWDGFSLGMIHSF